MNLLQGVVVVHTDLHVILLVEKMARIQRYGCGGVMW